MSGSPGTANVRVVAPRERGWDVLHADGKEVSSHHKTLEEAIVRAQEILLQMGGGQWIVRDQKGREVGRGGVLASWTHPWEGQELRAGLNAAVKRRGQSSSAISR
jgi:hypothetical protein